MENIPNTISVQVRARGFTYGGWILPMLGGWVGSDERPNDRSAPCDGYAMGLVG